MRGIRMFLLAALLCSSVTNVSAKVKTYDGVLPPEGRIVSGDLSKNEFFILGKEDRPAVAASASTIPAVTPHIDAGVHVASVNKSAPSGTSKFTPIPHAIDMRIEGKTFTPIIKTALGKSAYHIASINKSPKLKQAKKETFKPVTALKNIPKALPHNKVAMKKAKVPHGKMAMKKAVVQNEKVAVSNKVIERAATHLKRQQLASEKLAADIKLALNQTRHKV